MMINLCSDTQQDTVTGKIGLFQDSIRLKSDPASFKSVTQLKDTVHRKVIPVTKPAFIIISDTTSVCERNRVADITFYDSTNFVTNIESGSFQQFPFIFTAKNSRRQSEARAFLLKHLKSGQETPVQPLQDDWILVFILIAAFLSTLIGTTSKNMFTWFTRFFLFRGINDPASRDIGGLFHWQSTILNLISFMIVGLFGYTTASYYNIIPFGLKGILLLLISLGLVITAVTIRHIVCTVTGNASGERDLFREYLMCIYQSYRFSASLLFVIIMLMSYTPVLSARVCIFSGFIVLGVMYLFRVFRLLIIFLNRNISIFYLILYLCALEILPVLISVKYFTGLV